MKNIRLFAGSLGLLALLATAPVHAAQSEGPKAKLMAKYDTNKNGVIDGDEIAAVRAAFAAAPDGEFHRFDKNRDGKLDDEEIAGIKGPGAKDKSGKKGKKGDAPTEAKPEMPAKDEAPKPDAPKEAAKADAKEAGK